MDTDKDGFGLAIESSPWNLDWEVSFMIVGSDGLALDIPSSIPT
jgi:hypothetical protein